jgi:hypothetical protein
MIMIPSLYAPLSGGIRWLLPRRLFYPGPTCLEKKSPPFCTHGGGGKGHIIADVKKYCPDSVVLKELELYGRGGRNAGQKIRGWLADCGVLD